MSFVSAMSSVWAVSSELALAYGLYVVASVVCLVLAAKASKRVVYLSENEQVLIKQLTGKVVVNGPRIYFPSLITTLAFSKRKGTSLTALQYMSVKDEATGVVRVVTGPCVCMLGPYEAVHVSPTAAMVLTPTQCLTVLDQQSGEKRLICGPCTFVPGAYENVVARAEAVTLHRSQFVRIEDTLQGSVRVEKGEQTLWVQPHEKVLGGVTNAYSLKAHQQVRLRDTLSGAIRCERGEQLVFPSAHEVALGLDGSGTGAPVEDAVDLTSWEYCTVQDRATGKQRVERGEKTVFLQASERFIFNSKTPKNPKSKAIVIDTQHAALVRNRETGKQRLISEPQLFVPTVEEEVLEVRELICLSTHQAVVLKDEQGSHHIRFGDAKKGTERAFFLPPHWELVTLMWSRGRRREKRDLAIRVFDTRPQYMSFEFNCRTSDNVEMVLEGTFFWEVVDIQAMLEYTGDAPGDVCSHARSCFIQLISKVTLQQFMNEFNAIAKQAHTSDDLFYSQRGLKIHSLEVTRYACADHSTSAILEQIIAETTNRMNRLSCQESENEVCLARLQGEEEQENAKSAVLAIKQQHAVESAKAEGLAEAERCLSFLRHVRAEDKGKDGLAEELWHALRKAEALKDVSQGNAHVYFTPQDAHLTIENRQ